MNFEQQVSEGQMGAMRGMTAALEGANRFEEDWGMKAAACFAEYNKQFGELPYMTEDVRKWSEEGGLPPPPDRRAWGAVAMAMRKAGSIRSLGYAPQKSANAHCSPKTLWVRA